MTKNVVAAVFLLATLALVAVSGVFRTTERKTEEPTFHPVQEPNGKACQKVEVFEELLATVLLLVLVLGLDLDSDLDLLLVFVLVLLPDVFSAQDILTFLSFPTSFLNQALGHFLYFQLFVEICLIYLLPVQPA